MTLEIKDAYWTAEAPLSSIQFEATLSTMPFFNSNSNEKSYTINVKTYDEELHMPIEFDLKGNVVFEVICKALGLRETWYFGLMYECKKHKTLKWLKMKKKLSDLNLIKYSDNTIKMLLLIKLYPEAVSSELIQEYTQHLFYLQARQQIINEFIYCPAELCILLASYAAQAKVKIFFKNKFQVQVWWIDFRRILKLILWYVLDIPKR